MDTITFRDVRKSFPTFTLSDVNFSVPRGLITGFIGANGSGKTTTIKLILSLLRPDQGEIFYCGEEIKPDQLQYLQDIGVVTDEPFLGKDWFMDGVNQAMALSYDQWREDQFFNFLDRFQINRSVKVKDLSRGMRIKLMLSVALSHQAKTLILDEPTSGLDPVMRDEFTEVLQDFVLEEDHTVLFSTHITSDLEAVADYIIFLQEGKVIFTGPLEDFLSAYLVVKGGPDDLEGLPLSILIGTKTTSLGFESLIRTKDLPLLPEGLLKESPSIEKIMIFYGRRSHE